MRRIVTLATVALAVAAFLFIGWLAGLVIFAAATLAWFARIGRARAALAYESRCPRGHVVRQYGLFTCGCGAVTESLAWLCPVCGQMAGFIACPTCGLAVTNPMLH